MSEKYRCWSCGKSISNTNEMVADGPFENGEKHYYCNTNCWMRV